VAPNIPKLPKGFRASGHEFFVYGRCAACVPGKTRGLASRESKDRSARMIGNAR
jgi:hypothetical protein